MNGRPLTPAPSRRGWDAREAPDFVTNDDGVRFPMYGHIGLRRIDEWEAIFAGHGIECIDHERGAMFYGSTWHNHPIVFAAQLACEHVLDALPARLTRFLSDGLIGLHRPR